MSMNAWMDDDDTQGYADDVDMDWLECADYRCERCGREALCWSEMDTPDRCQRCGAEDAREQVFAGMGIFTTEIAATHDGFPF